MNFSTNQTGSKFSLTTLLLVIGLTQATAGNHTCPTMYSRNNGNGQSSSCPGVNSTPEATSVNGTPYNAIPSGSKTADIIMSFSASDAWATNPPVIIASYQTSGNTTTGINTYPGPPGVPDASKKVKYCSYTGASGNGNMPNAGIVSFRLATPTMVSDYLTCSYDFSSSDLLISNPTAVPLLVKFHSFTASYVNGKVDLEWATSVDASSDYFQIERSSDGINYTTLDKIKAVNESTNQTADYSFVDNLTEQATSSNLYYRIRQVDYDGTYEYTNVQKISLNNSNQTTSFYLAGQSLMVNNSTDETAVVQYFNISGMLLKEEEVHLAPGVTCVGKIDGANNGLIVRLITRETINTVKYL